MIFSVRFFRYMLTIPDAESLFAKSSRYNSSAFGFLELLGLVWGLHVYLIAHLHSYAFLDALKQGERTVRIRGLVAATHLQTTIGDPRYRCKARRVRRRFILSFILKYLVSLAANVARSWKYSIRNKRSGSRRRRNRRIAGWQLL